jgi:hypothetical protein
MKSPLILLEKKQYAEAEKINFKLINKQFKKNFLLKDQFCILDE